MTSEFLGIFLLSSFSIASLFSSSLFFSHFPSRLSYTNRIARADLNRVRVCSLDSWTKDPVEMETLSGAWRSWRRRFSTSCRPERGVYKISKIVLVLGAKGEFVLLFLGLISRFSRKRDRGWGVIKIYRIKYIASTKHVCSLILLYIALTISRIHMGERERGFFWVPKLFNFFVYKNQTR